MPTLVWTSLYTNEYITRNDFITNLRTRVDEDSSTGGFMTDNQLVQIINQGLIDIAHRTGILLQYCSISLDGSNVYTLPDDILNISKVYWVNSSGNGILLEPSNEEDIYSNGYTLSSEPNAYIRYGNKELVLYGDTGSGSLKVYANKIPEMPATGSDYIDLPRQYLEILYTWCMWWFFARRRIPDEMVFHRDMYFNSCESAKYNNENVFVSGLTLYGKKSL